MKLQFLAVLVAAAPAWAWAQTDAAIDACHGKQSTVEIVDCLGKLSAQADAHLNTAFQKTLKSLDASGVPALRAAERAWLDYRKQRCTYLTAGLGTLGQVVGADCMLTMTRARAAELDTDSKGQGEQ